MNRKALVMKNVASPRAHFITWIALLDRLSNAARLLKWGLLLNTNCRLSSREEETVEHLFFV